MQGVIGLRAPLCCTDDFEGCRGAWRKDCVIPPQKPRRAREIRSLRHSTPQTEHTLNTFFRFVFVAETEEKNQYDHVVLNGAKYASLCSVKSEWTRIDWDGQEWTQG